MDHKQFEIDGDVFNVAQATAIQQKTLMNLIGAKILFYKSTSGVDEISVSMLKGALLTVDENIFDRIASIVLTKCFRHGSDNPVTISDFQGKMNIYLTLIAEGVKYNLTDFFTWLDTETMEESATLPPKETME